jgi:hypothetical protein
MPWFRGGSNEYIGRAQERRRPSQPVSVIPAKAGTHVALALGRRKKIKMDPAFRRDDEVRAAFGATRLTA